MTLSPKELREVLVSIVDVQCALLHRDLKWRPWPKPAATGV